jgi:Carboxypeptidase regulatory-like domain
MSKAVRSLVFSGVLIMLLGTPLAPASPSLAFLSGTVRDDAGDPLVGAIVALFEPQFGGRELKSLRTDIAGKFSAGLTRGSYRVRAEAEGFRPMVTLINLDRTDKLTYDFSLKRRDTVVEKRGDRDDYRWIGRGVPRSVLHVAPDDPATADASDPGVADVAEAQTGSRNYFHGAVQFVGSTSPSAADEPGFFGTNFAVAGSFGGNLELALVGQQSLAGQAPQRLAAFATLRPVANHQITTSFGYGQVPLGRRPASPRDTEPDGLFGMRHPISKAMLPPGSDGFRPEDLNSGPIPTSMLDQISISAVDSWQVAPKLLLIYGFDYSRFVGGAVSQRESVLPRIAVQFTPTSRTRLNAAVTPGAGEDNLSRADVEGLNTEGLHIPFETRPQEIAVNESPVLDRSRRFEVGVEHLLGNGSSSIEATAFYDVIAGHGVGVLALPLEASPETQATFDEVVHQVAAMNGAARGIRISYSRRFNDHVTASAGYSFGAGARFSDLPLATLSPDRLFSRGFFQVSSAKLDLDFTEQTGTRISTVVRLSPSAVVFAIDPFAGRMSVYDPNINIYITQDLPSFGLPLRWQAVVDIRNLLDQLNGTEDGSVQLLATRTRRCIRGGISFRW